MGMQQAAVGRPVNNTCFAWVQLGQRLQQQSLKNNGSLCSRLLGRCILVHYCQAADSGM